jgi:hypothetical protein
LVVEGLTDDSILKDFAKQDNYVDSEPLDIEHMDLRHTCAE